MSEMMRGLVSFPNGDLKLQDVPVPVVGQNRFAPHDVLCEVEYCGICGSDVHKFLAEESEKAKTKHVPAPVVSGHEIVSVVRAVGKNVKSVKPGDRVVHEIVTFYCGH
ncbi:MAG: L-iditol 2-dehydrogenase [Spirochaetes bacterium]|nr:MAG: L-iditol 2-dehydrogenase [Spirochaetota bacterium]